MVYSLRIGNSEYFIHGFRDQSETKKFLDDEGIKNYSLIPSKLNPNQKIVHIYKIPELKERLIELKKIPLRQSTNLLESFVHKLKRIGIEVELIGNAPWIYLRSVNGKPVQGKYLGNHGFTAFFMATKMNDPVPFHFSDSSIVFDKIRETLCQEEIVPKPKKVLTPLQKTMSSFQIRVDNLKKQCGRVWDINARQKQKINYHNEFLNKLIAENRLTKEEVRAWFKKTKQK
jgi:hypothetical protein